MALKSKKQLFLQEAWKKAYRDGGAELTFAKPGDKVRARMMLYNAVKLGKQNLDDDLEVNQAAQAIEIVEGPDPLKLYMRLASESPAMQAVAGLLGHSLASAKDATAEESLALLDSMGISSKAPPLLKGAPQSNPSFEGPDAIEHKANPFYDKRG